MKSVDLSQQEIITAKDVESAGISGAAEILAGTRAVLENDARDLLVKYAIAVRFVIGMESLASDSRVENLFNSPQARVIKEEICAVGRKLWLRGLVNGNGGNISCRVGENEVICTPTLFSKFDLTPKDLCLVDIEGKHIAGCRSITSEVYLHLEVYKNEPKAKSVVHCHPPHATAYAICGHVPPTSLSSEFDVFIGGVALAGYETPGTREFAKTVRPYVQDYNVILLANHGILCWADTPTHAEWYAENLEIYCQTLLIARQLGVPYSPIPPSKEEDLLAIRKRLGLPNNRGKRN